MKMTQGAFGDAPRAFSREGGRDQRHLIGDIGKEHDVACRFENGSYVVDKRLRAWWVRDPLAVDPAGCGHLLVEQPFHRSPVAVVRIQDHKTRQPSRPSLANQSGKLVPRAIEKAKDFVACARRSFGRGEAQQRHACASGRLGGRFGRAAAHGAKDRDDALISNQRRDCLNRLCRITGGVLDVGPIDEMAGGGLLCHLLDASGGDIFGPKKQGTLLNGWG